MATALSTTLRSVQYIGVRACVLFQEALCIDRIDPKYFRSLCLPLAVCSCSVLKRVTIYIPCSSLATIKRSLTIYHHTSTRGTSDNLCWLNHRSPTFRLRQTACLFYWYFSVFFSTFLPGLLAGHYGIKLESLLFICKKKWKVKWQKTGKEEKDITDRGSETKMAPKDLCKKKENVKDWP